jgi:DNA-directed RNA polymerase subunit RPC12/RpoP
MERNVISWKSSSENDYHRENETDFRCGECGEEFHKPLLARNSSRGSIQTYYACPRCLTEVADNRKQRSGRSVETPIPLRETRGSSEKLERSVDCQHFFGYLKKRPKDTSIPEDCLTCEKMIECMVY